MTPFLQLVFVLAVILFTAKLGGYLTTLIGQPSVLGELIVGLILGPSLLDITHLPFLADTHLSEVITEIGELGVLLLMFIAGLELHLSEMARSARVSALAGTLGVVVPVGLGVLIGRMFGVSMDNAIFLGLTMGATSVSISAQTLMEMRVLRSRVGLGLLGAAVFDDVLVILMLSGFLALQSGGSGAEILLVLVRMLAFFAFSVAFGLFVLPALSRRVRKLPISQGLLAFSLVILLVYGLLAEVVGGMAAITGTFVAGLMFSRTPEKAQIQEGMNALAYGLLVPIFFVNIGLTVNLRTLESSAFVLMVLVIIGAILGKILGCGLGAKVSGFSYLESLQLGIGMVSRGEVGLIVGSAGLASGLLSANAFSAVISMVLVTTLVTPPLLRWSFQLQARTAAGVQPANPAPGIDED